MEAKDNCCGEQKKTCGCSCIENGKCKCPCGVNNCQKQTDKCCCPCKCDTCKGKDNCCCVQPKSYCCDNCNCGCNKEGGKCTCSCEGGKCEKKKD